MTGVSRRESGRAGHAQTGWAVDFIGRSETDSCSVSASAAPWWRSSSPPAVEHHDVGSAEEYCTLGIVTLCQSTERNDSHANAFQNIAGCGTSMDGMNF